MNCSENDLAQIHRDYLRECCEYSTNALKGPTRKMQPHAPKHELVYTPVPQLFLVSITLVVYPSSSLHFDFAIRILPYAQMARVHNYLHGLDYSREWLRALD